MEASQVWELFEKTGNVGVYILYKKLSDGFLSEQAGDEKGTDADTNRGNSDKGNKCR